MARVSEVIDWLAEPYLVAWKLKNRDWEKISKQALELGSMIDHHVHVDINEPNMSELASNDPQVNNCWKAWTKFKAERPDVLERLVKYKANMQRELTLGDLVGHPDFILDDEVIDLKTSKSVSKSHWMQTAQYAHMYYRCDDKADPIKRISILRLDKATGEYEYKTLEEPFITFWQRKFQARYEAFCEDAEWAEMERKRLSKEVLG